MRWRTLVSLWRSFASPSQTSSNTETATVRASTTPSTRKLEVALQQVIGKRVTAVVFALRPREPSQMYLIFDDDSHYEFYGIGGMSGARAVDPGGLDYVRLVTQDAEEVVEIPAPK